MDQYASLLETITGLKDPLTGAFSLRLDGAPHSMQSTEHITIRRKTDKPGIDIIIAPGTKTE